tara:strand:+ start:4442 stop:7792 length:3351 start_codon:yes stop_codon:yes gene_type:complete
MPNNDEDPQKQFDNIINLYLDNVTNSMDGESELEVRFGTRGIKPITKMDYDNIIQTLVSSNFEMTNSNAYSLKMQSEFVDKNTGKTRPSNVRVEINGQHDVQKYCNTNSLKETTASFIQKKNASVNGANVFPVNVDDFNFRVSYQKERAIASYSPFAESIKSSWQDSKKTFRYINRVSFIHPTIPVRVDLSIVKESHKEKYRMKPEYTFQGAEVTSSPEKYEIELEVLNSKIGVGTEYNNGKKLGKELRKAIKVILSGLQRTKYPISYKEIANVGVEYLQLVHGKKYYDKMKMDPKNFMGPSSYTLQIQNIAPINEDSTMPNIRNNYTVTEKADGMRKLMYTNSKGRIYLIDTNMNVQFTGAVTDNVDCYNTIIDGEHILHNKRGDYINLYAAFDIYIENKKDVRAYAFIPPSDSGDDKVIRDMTKYRLPILVNMIKNLAAHSVNSATQPANIRIENKNFKAENDRQDIFQCCNTILTRQNEGQYEYEVDGLIFTPAYLGVGSSVEGQAGRLTKSSWAYSFKWKPPQYNTIDFLVTTKKNEAGGEYIGNIFQQGTSAVSYEQIEQYQTLILRVGFDERKDGYINPCAIVINDDIPSIENIDNADSYKPVPFYPTNPTDSDASICNILLKTDQNGTKQLFTEEGEVFGDEMIVEFRYELTRDKQWRWVPLRVRYDKTSEYKQGFRNYGNAYHVANNNWYSIHNPVTEQMIGTGLNIPNELGDDDVYYNRVSGVSMTRGLRDFHNLFIKKFLVMSISKRGNTLIDYAVGKGGDFPKWINAKLSFVFGIDIAKDNIENRLDGACARYLNYRKMFKVMPNALFVHGNSGLNLKNGEAFYSDKSKQITNAVFGEGAKSKEQLGNGVYKQYGKASEGFNISSCQFAIHYFFENIRNVNRFLRNVSECTKINGYFIGTSYNGESIFNALRGVKQGESISIIEKDKKIWQITKQYDHDTFDADETGLGYAIDVYQETINKTFREYLVNYDYLTRLMENYGFVLLSRDECKELGIPESVGSFRQLHGLMEQEIVRNNKRKNDYGDATKMTSNEKQISYYNNYFIYKKIRNVNTKSIESSLSDVTELQEQLEKIESSRAETNIEIEENIDIVKAPVKINRKLTLRG